MKGASTRPTKKKAAARAAVADAAGYLSIPNEQEFRESLVILSVVKKLGHPEAWDFAAARIIPKGSPRAPSGWNSEVTSEPHGWLEIPHLPWAISDPPGEFDRTIKETHDSLVATRLPLRGERTPPGTWQGSMAFGMAMDQGMPTEAEMRATAIESFPQLRAYFPHYFDDAELPDYTADAPLSEAAVTPPLRMRDDLNTSVKRARAEVSDSAKAELAKVRTALLAAQRLATYEVLARNVDLGNSTLAPDERRRRANRLLTAYDRLRAVKPDFKDSNAQLTAARRIKKAAHRERQRAMRGEGSTVRSGRPRKVALG
jgi:hypothetical protein